MGDEREKASISLANRKHGQMKFQPPGFNVSSISLPEAAQKAFLTIASTPDSNGTYFQVIRLGIAANVPGARAFEHALRIATGDVPHGGRPPSYAPEIAMRDALIAAGWTPQGAVARVLANEPDRQRRDRLARALRRTQ